MKILYITYQVCFALPILLVLTILTALVTIIGSLIGGAHTWGYYPGKIWSQLICYILLIPVEVHGREKIHKRTSYVFVPNHQGMRKRRTYLRQPFQPQESACHHAAGRIIFERRRITGSISRRGTYLHGTHGLLQERSLPAGG